VEKRYHLRLCYPEDVVGDINDAGRTRLAIISLIDIFTFQESLL
jgi:hypothetical protein